MAARLASTKTAASATTSKGRAISILRRNRARSFLESPDALVGECTAQPSTGAMMASRSLPTGAAPGTHSVLGLSHRLEDMTGTSFRGLTLPCLDKVL